MDFRVAEYKDYERIAHLHAQNWKKHYRQMLTDDYLDNDVLNDKLLIWQIRLTNPPFNQHVVLIEEGGLLIGFVCLFGNHDFERGSFIDALHVDENYQGKGIGKLLLDQVADWNDRYFPDAGIYLEVNAENTAAVEFYQSVGGEELPERERQSPDGEKTTEKIFFWKKASYLKPFVSSNVTADV